MTDNGAEQENLGIGDGECRLLGEHLRQVILKGSWMEMGRQYGALLKTELGRTLDRANQCGNEVSDSFFSPDGVPSGMAFMDEFFRGMAETSGLSLSQLIRANSVEVAFGNALNEVLARGGHCGTLVLAPELCAGKQLLMARNYDWLPSFADLDLVIAELHPAREQPMLSINFAGCLYMTTGMNAAGLFIELNSGVFACSAMKPECRQNAWMLWEVLRQAESVEQATAMLEKIPAAAFYIIGLGDAQKAAAYEWAVDRKSVSRSLSACSGRLAFTNHFLQPGWQNTDAAELGGNISSVARQKALQQLAEQLPEEVSVADLQQLLAVPVEEGGARWSGTLFQVIAVPADKMLLLRQGEEDWKKIGFCDNPQKIVSVS